MNRTVSAPQPGARARLLGTLIAALLRLLSVTWRTETHGLDRLDGLLADGGRVLLVFWHGGYVPLFALLRGREATILSSDSFRGRVIAQICRRFGYRDLIVPGTHRASGHALLQAASRTGTAIALAADGPLGPLHVVKPGVVSLASDRGFVVVPVAAAGRRNWAATRRWDRMEIPRPFTRVALFLGPPIPVPPNLGRFGIPEWQERVGDALNKATRRARRLSGQSDRDCAGSGDIDKGEEPL